MTIPLWMLMYLENVFSVRLHPVIAIIVIATMLYLTFLAIRAEFTPDKNGK